MALNATVLASMIVANVEADTGIEVIDPEGVQAIARAIVDHITESAEVNTEVTTTTETGTGVGTIS